MQKHSKAKQENNKVNFPLLFLDRQHLPPPLFLRVHYRTNIDEHPSACQIRINGSYMVHRPRLYDLKCGAIPHSCKTFREHMSHL